MSNRAVKKNQHRNPNRSLWKPAEDAYRGSADAPHRDIARRSVLSFSHTCALAKLYAEAKVDGNVYTRLRSGTASEEEQATFQALLVEREVAVAANAERRSNIRAYEAEANSVRYRGDVASVPEGTHE
jgi:hypothetical protein